MKSRGQGARETMCKLVIPSMQYDKQIQLFRKDFLINSNGDLVGCFGLKRMDDTNDWIKQLDDFSNAETCPEGFVPTTQFIYVRESDDKIIGVIQIRHYFNERIEKYFGNIGYSICPSERRKGYATKMLEAALEYCKEIGLDKVLITCEPDNEGSRRTILKNGGKYENTVHFGERDEYLERYWITLD